MHTRTDDLIRCDVLFELKWDPKIRYSFPGTACQAAIGVSLRDGLVHASQGHLARERASNLVTPFVRPKIHPELPLSSCHSASG